MKLRKFIFSRPSKILHTVWFTVWFILGLDIDLLTLIVSLEAIYLELFLGDNQSDLRKSDNKQFKLIEELHEFHFGKKGETK